MPAVLAAVRPRVLLLNNLFRDQLDRYGELETIYSKWRAALPRLSPQARLVLNADDPAIAGLAATEGLRAKPFTFGIEDGRYSLAELPHAADSISCPRCSSRLEYSLVLLSHLGHWRCPNCGLQRPTPDVAATRVKLNGTESSLVSLRLPQGDADVTIRVPGLYNVYNGLAAVAATLAFGVPFEHIKAGLESFTAAFGRIERVDIPGEDDKSLLMALVKNPVGFNEVLRMLFPPDEDAPGQPRDLLIIINDLIADGRDVSWLWDVDFEVLTNSAPPSGQRTRVGHPRRRYGEPSQIRRRAHNRHPYRPFARCSPRRSRSGPPGGPNPLRAPHLYRHAGLSQNASQSRLGPKPILGRLNERRTRPHDVLSNKQ